jgi:hypothetical protein
MELIYNNPVVHVFVDLLVESQKEKQMRLGMKLEKGEKQEKLAKYAKKLWLCVLLSKRKDLIKYRKTNWNLKFN